MDHLLNLYRLMMRLVYTEFKTKLQMIQKNHFSILEKAGSTSALDEVAHESEEEHLPTQQSQMILIEVDAICHYIHDSLLERMGSEIVHHQSEYQPWDASLEEYQNQRVHLVIEVA